MIVRKAIDKDREAVLQLLNELNPNISAQVWNRTFDAYYSKGQAYFGFVMEVEKEIQGFIGAIIADRKYHDTEITVCNTHSWIVREKYKSLSMKMINEVLKEDLCFTNFSTQQVTYAIFKRLKFKELKSDFQIYRPGFKGMPNGIVKVLHEGLEGISNDEIMVNHHLDLGAEVVKIKNENGKSCFLVFKPEGYVPSLLRPVSFLIPAKWKRHLKVEYVSDMDIFLANFESMALKMLIGMKGFGFILPLNYVEKMELKSKKYFGQRKYMFLDRKPLLQDFIPDTMYSELFYLGLPG